jgi:hypothetical protein
MVAAFARARCGYNVAMVRVEYDGQPVTQLETQLEILQAIKEYELTHRLQLFPYLRFKGIVPATTRRWLAKQASK